MTSDTDVVGMWVTADGHIRQELRADGRYDEARGDRRSAYTGRYTVTGSHLDYVDDTGFTATGDIRDGVLYHEHLVLYRESAGREDPPGRLDGKVALITGATGGIGQATAELFAREGARLIVTDLVKDATEELAERLIAEGAEVLAACLDVSSPENWSEVVQLTGQRFGRLDILVNLAGVVDWPGIEDTTQDSWERVIAINQTGTWLGMKTAMPLLRASGNASIINTSSVLGLVGSGAAAAYQASKGAVRLLSKTAAVEYATRGVRINSVHPGVIATPMIQDLLDEQGDRQPDIVRTPMRRAGFPAEVASVMLFLAGDESSFVTGTELVVDGGLTAY